MKRQAYLIADLGYGDAGKGTVTDYLVRKTGAELVVRYNGGAQAGHTVVLGDGRSHTFSQVGAGSFVAGVRTHLSRFMLVHPGGLLEEAAVLQGKGVPAVLDRLSIDGQALVISPFQQATNRLREVLRGEARHGSCGLGIGETAQDRLTHPQDVTIAADLPHPEQLRPKLISLQQRKWELFSEHRRELRRHPQGARELDVLESADLSQRWIEQAKALSDRVRIGPTTLPQNGSFVFEGAQGVLLDEWRGFHPHTTWSTCTFANALALLEGWDGQVRRLGVARSYATRHGAGPFPTEDASLDTIPEPHNSTGAWQGAFRRGWFDVVATRYAIDCCGGIDGLVLTHLDSVQGDWKICTSYGEVPERFYSSGRLRLGPFGDLEYQERLGRAIAGAAPRYQHTLPDGFVHTLEDLLQTPVLLQSWGPCPQDKRTAVGPLTRSPSCT